jgi:hypothetical protein
MRPMHPPPRAKWKTAVVAAEDPVEFAQQFEEHMNALVSEGWNIQGMIQRGAALIITAIKPDLPQEVLDALARMAPKPMAPPAATPMGEPSSVTYNYLEEGSVRSLTCETLEEAVRYMREHVNDETCLPIGISVMHVSSYEPADLPMLETMVKGRFHGG